MKFFLVSRNKNTAGSQGCGFPTCSAVLLLRYQADANAHIHLFILYNSGNHLLEG